MEQKKSKTKYFWYFIIIMFIIYISLFIANESGYYENKVRKKSIITSEGIKQFEEDVKNGLNVEMKDYIEVKQNYDNKFSDFGIKLSNITEKVMSDGIDTMVDVLGKLFSS